MQKRLIFRLSDNMYYEIVKAVKMGKAKTNSDLIRLAVEEFLKKIHQMDPELITVVITGNATIESAVEATKLGAYDYLPKPFDPVLLRTRVNTSLTMKRLYDRERSYTGRMLVVDDDALNRTLLATSLEEKGYTIEIAEDGHQALEMLHARIYDVVFLDLLMPEMDGFEVLQRMKAESKLQHIPVIVV